MARVDLEPVYNKFKYSARISNRNWSHNSSTLEMLNIATKCMSIPNFQDPLAV